MRYADYSIYKKPINANYVEKFGFMIGNRSKLFSEKEKKILKNLVEII